jgi:hypothetical protein
MDRLFDLLTFFSTSFGLAVTGATAAALILFWDWRLALAGLVVVQIGVATVTVQVEHMPAEWAAIMTAVTCLACLILALSAQQAGTSPSLRQAGTWLLRALALALVYLAWRALGRGVRLPELVPQVTALFVWLGICVLMILGMSNDPLFTAVGLLLWCIPVQAVVAVLLGVPALIALIGILELVVALACSYLVLAEQLPAVEQQPVLTDITFPDRLPGALPSPATPRPDDDGAGGDAVRRPAHDGLRDGALGWWRGLWGRPHSRRPARPVRPARPAPEQPQGRAILARKRS